MKKAFLLLIIGLFSINISFAQNNDELKRGFEDLSGELEKMFQDFEILLNGEALAKLDTLDIKKFGFDIDALEKQLEGKDMNSLNLTDMMDLMQTQMNMLDQIDFSQFNQLFKDLGIDAPGIPAPNQRDRVLPKSNDKNKATKKGKKRKSYKL